jgi:hypothetical protein
MLTIRNLMQSLSLSLVGAMVLYMLCLVSFKETYRPLSLPAQQEETLVAEEIPPVEATLTESFSSGSVTATGFSGSTPFVKPFRFAFRELNLWTVRAILASPAVSLFRTFSSFRILPNAP